jgi:hypothetical protein
MTFRTSSGGATSSNDIARIVMSRPACRRDSVRREQRCRDRSRNSIPPSNTGPDRSHSTRGDWVSLTGEIHIGSEGNPAIGVNGLAGVLAPGAPVANGASGALIGRVGNSAPFLIGNQSRMQMPAAGQLFLGVNDGNLPDNTGSFQVQVTLDAGTARRR